MDRSPPNISQDTQQIPPDYSALSGLTDAVRAELREKGKLVRYWPGDPIRSTVGGKEAFHFVVSGSARVILEEKEGLEIELETLAPGDVIGEISLLTGRQPTRDIRVVAENSCVVLTVPSEDMKDVLEKHPDLNLKLMTSLAQKVIRLDKRVHRGVMRKLALQKMISRDDQVFRDYFISDKVFKRLGPQMEQLDRSASPILILGETGVGKDFIAHTIYKNSTHHKRVFLYLDLLRPDRMTRPSLLGHEDIDARPRSSEEQTRLLFGAESKRSGDWELDAVGYIELAEGGALLIRGGELLTPEVQRMLLKVCETGVFRRVGGRYEQRADVRVIITTRLDEKEITEDGHPLLQSLSNRTIHMHPLRKRRKEIPELARYYVERYTQELHKDRLEFPKATMKLLLAAPWPGNDLEMAMTIKRAILVSEGGVISPNSIYFDIRSLEDSGKYNLLAGKGWLEVFQSPLFPTIFQSAAVPFFFILMILLFLGPSNPLQNPGGLFSWAVGWPMMIFGSFFWARFWCSLCPIGVLSKLAKKILALEIPFPAVLKQYSDWIIALSALIIIWLEVVTDIRSSPFNTGLLLLVMLLSAIIVSVIFERQSWCRYLCGLGGIMGVFAKTSPIELRADRKICTQCTSNECYTGVDGREGCPFGQLAPTIHSNRFCKLCGACIKNCPNSGLKLSLRIPGKEIWEVRQTNAVLSFFVMALLGGIFSEMTFHSETYHSLMGSLTGGLCNYSQHVCFTVFFLAVVLAVNLSALVMSGLSSLSTGEGIFENFARFGQALLPIVLATYMALHLYYLINLGVRIPILLFERFQFEIFRQLVLTVPQSVTSALQSFLVLIGCLWSLGIVYRLSRKGSRTLLRALPSFLPYGILAVGITVISIKIIRSYFYGT